MKINMHKNIIFLVILYGRETWSLILRSVFENRVLEKIFWPKWDEVQGSGEECITTSFMICTPYHQVNQMNEMDGVFGTYGRQERCTKRFGGGPDGKRPLERLRRRWE
jgi:hypothetical protein